MSRVLVQGVLAVLAYDFLASLASRALAFPYGYASIGSLIVYLAFCVLAGRKFGLRGAVVLGVLMGVADATAGWALSYAIGPGKPEPAMSIATWLAGFVGAAALGLVCGLVGGGIGTFVKRRHAA